VLSRLKKEKTHYWTMGLTILAGQISSYLWNWYPVLGVYHGLNQRPVHLSFWTCIFECGRAKKLQYFVINTTVYKLKFCYNMAFNMQSLHIYPQENKLQIPIYISEIFSVLSIDILYIH
jgi:hypothetical protein